MTDFSFAVEETDNGSTARVYLGGNLQIVNALQLHHQVLETVEKFPQVQLHLKDVTALDAAVMQVLLAAKNHTGTSVTVHLDKAGNSVMHWLRVAGLAVALAS